MLHSDVIVGPLEQRGVTVDAVDIFVDGSSTQLPLSSECVNLAGSILHVCGTHVFDAGNSKTDVQPKSRRYILDRKSRRQKAT